MKKEKVTKFADKVYKILKDNNWVIHTNSLYNEHVPYEKFVDKITNSIEQKVTPVVEISTIRGTDSYWTVRKYVDGTYSCACPLFTEKFYGEQPCHHIINAVHRLTPIKSAIVVTDKVNHLSLDFGERVLYVPKKYSFPNKIFNMGISMDEADFFYSLIKSGWSLSDIVEQLNFTGKYSGFGFMSKILQTSSIPQSKYHAHIETTLHEDKIC